MGPGEIRCGPLRNPAQLLRYDALRCAWAGLENRRGLTALVGSNPTLSATNTRTPPRGGVRVCGPRGGLRTHGTWGRPIRACGWARPRGSDWRGRPSGARTAATGRVTNWQSQFARPCRASWRGRPSGARTAAAGRVNPTLSAIQSQRWRWSVLRGADAKAQRYRAHLQPVAILQHLPLDTPAIDEAAVGAVHVFEDDGVMADLEDCVMPTDRTRP